MNEKSRDRRKNSSYPEIRVKRVWVNEFQQYFIDSALIYYITRHEIKILAG